MGKLGTLKKSLFAVILVIAASYSLYSQNNPEQSINLSQSFDESTVVFSDPLADTSAALNGAASVGIFVRMIVVLIIVVILIYGVFWFIKKKSNVVKTDDDFLRRAAYINIAPGKTVEVITLIDKAYLIGVTEENITLLGEIEDKELIQAMNLNADKKQNTKKAVNFEEVLGMFTRKSNSTKNVFLDSEKQVDNLFSNLTGNTESE